MSTIKVTNIEALSGGGLPDNLLPQTVSARVNFDGIGTVTINDSFNVDSITDDGVGLYTVNFTTDLTNTNYAWAGSSLSSSNSPIVYERGVRTTSALLIQTQEVDGTAGNQDQDNISVIVFGGT